MLNTTKQCTQCDKIKNISEFNKHNRRKNGRVERCRVCTRSNISLYKKSKDGVACVMYSSQRTSSKKRGYEMPNYTLKDFKEWLFSQDLFEPLYKEWVESGYNIRLKPSCDRHNEEGDYDYLPYTLDLLSLTTWGENSEKGNRDRRKGKNNKDSKKVSQFTMNGEFIQSFYSLREASRVVGVELSGISRTCLHKQKYSGGFKWEYAGTPSK